MSSSSRSNQYSENNEENERQVKINKEEEKYCDNRITTSHYTAWNFLLKNLFEQFSHTSNIYFLVVGFLQMIDEISTQDGQPFLFIPLAFIVVVTGIKDIYEDYQRHKEDASENNREIIVLDNISNININANGNNNSKKVQQKLLRVGQIIKILQNEVIPADMVLLGTPDKNGKCFIETKNLDGETNLKQRYLPNKLNDIQENVLDGGTVYCQAPSHQIHNFVGRLEIQGKQPIPLDIKNILLRGYILRNTQYAIGVIVYTGHETKVMLNLISARGKRSKVGNLVNLQMKWIFVALVIICLFTSTYHSQWYQNNKSELGYLHIDPKGIEDNTTWYNIIVRFGNWMMQLSNFIPISLLITLDITRICQSLLLARDSSLYSELNQVNVGIQTSSVNEDLGQVKYIFSDKTGTLTCNQMNFKKMYVDGVLYGEDNQQQQQQQQQQNEIPNVDFEDEKLFNELKQNPNGKLFEMILSLAVCHSLLAEEKDNKLIYNGASPDEIALVYFAQYCGIKFKGIDENNNIEIDNQGKNVKYKLLNYIEFNSNRKRSTVIIQDSSHNNKILLYCKGADSVIEERLKDSEKDGQNMKQCKKVVDQVSKEGLRTLLFGRKEVSEGDYKQWLEKYNKAKSQIQDRDEQISKIEDEIEQDFELLGASAIEDRLQDQVPETIKLLRETGIKVYMLTGDKLETAINIGYSCHLLTQIPKRFIIDKENDEIIQQIENALNEVDQQIQEQQQQQQGEQERQEDYMDNYALIVTGPSFYKVCEQEDIQEKFVKLMRNCDVMIGCRVSPKQKQEFVKILRKHLPNDIILAIGDGANDVNMITEANVGVGIKGVEGHQASRASDFSIGEFKLLRPLLLCYGREYYRKNSDLVCYNFYKNILMLIPNFWFGFENGFSGQFLFDVILFQFYNVFYTALPIMVYAIFDQEFKKKELLVNTQYYQIGLNDDALNPKEIWRWIFKGFVHAFFIEFLAIYSLGQNFTDTQGTTEDISSGGMLIFTAQIIISNLIILFISHRINFLLVFSIFLSLLSYGFMYYLTSLIQSEDIYHMFQRHFQLPMIYIVSVLTVVATVWFDKTIKAYKRFFSKNTSRRFKGPQEKQPLLLSDPKENHEILNISD